MEGVSQLLRRGAVNRLPLVILLGFVTSALGAVFAFSDSAAPPAGTRDEESAGAELEAQVRAAQERLFEMLEASAEDRVSPDPGTRRAPAASARELAAEEEAYRAYRERSAARRPARRAGTAGEPERERADPGAFRAVLSAPARVDLPGLSASSGRPVAGTAPGAQEERGSGGKDSGNRGYAGLTEYRQLVTRDHVNPARPAAPGTPYVLMQGSVIPAVLLTGINSELPGQVSAQVTDDILDSPTGEHLLIPRGARMVGQYGSNARYAQERVFLGFNRLIFPDGRALSLNAMPGQAQDGYAGLDAEVDNHYWKLITGCLLLSSITTAGYLSSRDTPYYNRYGAANAGAAFGQALAGSGTEAAEEIAERSLNVSPTLMVEPGFVFSVAVTQDLYFDGPYRFGAAGSPDFYIKD